MLDFGYRFPRFARSILVRVMVVLALSCLSHNSFGQTLQIDRLKANYLVGFIDFTQWDSSSGPDPTTIAVISDRDLYNELARIAANLPNGREVEIIHLKAGDSPPIEKIDILFVEKGQDTYWQTIKGRCMEAGILLVGEENRFMEDGGVIQFVYRKNRLRFIVNQDNADRQGIVLSSKLIELSVDKR